MMLPNYQTTPRHVVDGVWQGMELFANEAWHGMLSAANKPFIHMSREGIYGFGKGVCVGTYDLTRALVDGSLDLVSNVVEGVRNTPDTVTDACIGEDRQHWRYIVDDAEGRILETRLKGHPTQLVQGCVHGTKALTQGVTHAAIDLVSKPVEYIVKEPALVVGAAKGIGGGIAGFTAKSAAGVLDFTDAFADGIRNTPNWISDEISDFKGVPRREPPTLNFSTVGSGHRYWDNPMHAGGHPGVAQLAAQPGGWAPPAVQETIPTARDDGAVEEQPGLPPATAGDGEAGMPDARSVAGSIAESVGRLPPRQPTYAPSAYHYDYSGWQGAPRYSPPISPDALRLPPYPEELWELTVLPSKTLRAEPVKESHVRVRGDGGVRRWA